MMVKTASADDCIMNKKKVTNVFCWCVFPIHNASCMLCCLSLVAVAVVVECGGKGDGHATVGSKIDDD